MYNGKKKIEENTEYSIRMPDGKVQKFAYYGEKENGRPILLNTKYGTLTSMGAAYFMKLISGKYPCTKRPYNVEYPEDYKVRKAPSAGEILNKGVERYEERLKQQDKETVDKETAEMLRWATQLKTLPERESEILERELKIAPQKLGEDLEMWSKDGVIVSPLQTLTAYEQAKKLLKGTEWGVK